MTKSRPLSNPTDRARWSALIAIAFAAFMLAGCNTIDGASEDVEAAGDAVEETVDDLQN